MSSSSAVVPDGRAPGDRRVEALADVPQRGPGAGSAVSVARPGDRQRPRARRRPRRRAASATAAAESAWYSTSRAACSVDGDPRAGSRRPAGRPGPTRSDVASSSSMVAGPVADQGGQRAGAPRQVVEHQQRRSWRARSSGTVRMTTVGDERQRALAADHQVGQDVDRPGVVEQRVEPVAHGVLHRELLLDRAHRARRCRAPGRGAGPAPRTARVRAPRAARRRRRRRCRRRCRWAARATSDSSVR